MDTDFTYLQTKRTSERLNIMLTAHHKDALKLLAKIEAESMSVVIRNLIKKAAINRGLWNKFQESVDRRNNQC